MLAPIANPQQRDLQIRDRCRQLPVNEKATLIRILEQLSSLDEQLADLHLLLPVVDIRFYCLAVDPRQSASINPNRLLELLLGRH